MRKKAFILVVGIIIAAGALFTTVYDVIYRYNSSNTTNLNAASSVYYDPSGTYFSATGSGLQCNEITTLNFNNGTWMVFFNGQQGYAGGIGALCFAF